MGKAAARFPMALPPWRYTGSPSAATDGSDRGVLEAADDLPWPASAYRRPIVCARNAALAAGNSGSVGGIPDAHRGQQRYQAVDGGGNWLYTLWEPANYWGKPGTPVTAPRLVLLTGLADVSGANNWTYQKPTADAGADQQLTVDAIDELHDTHFEPLGLSVLLDPLVVRRILTGLPIYGRLNEDDDDGFGGILDSHYHWLVDADRLVGGDLLVVHFRNSRYQLGYMRAADEATYNLFAVAGSAPNWPHRTVYTGASFVNPITGLPPNQYFAAGVATTDLDSEHTDLAAAKAKFNQIKVVYLYDTHYDGLTDTANGPSFTAGYEGRFRANPPITIADYTTEIRGSNTDVVEVDSFDSRDTSGTKAKVQALIEAMWP